MRIESSLLLYRLRCCLATEVFIPTFGYNEGRHWSNRNWNRDADWRGLNASDVTYLLVSVRQLGLTEVVFHSWARNIDQRNISNRLLRRSVGESVVGILLNSAVQSGVACNVDLQRTVRNKVRCCSTTIDRSLSWRSEVKVVWQRCGVTTAFGRLSAITQCSGRGLAGTTAGRKGICGSRVYLQHHLTVSRTGGRGSTGRSRVADGTLYILFILVVVRRFGEGCRTNLTVSKRTRRIWGTFKRSLLLACSARFKGRPTK